MGGRGASSGAKVPSEVNPVFRDWLNSTVFKSQVANGQITLGIDDRNQINHLLTPQWKNQVKQAIASYRTGGDGRPKSILDKSIDTQKIVDTYAGTGSIRYNSKSIYPEEFIKLPFIVGKTFDRKTGRYVSTNTLQIKYGKNGPHIFPTKEKK